MEAGTGKVARFSMAKTLLGVMAVGVAMVVVAKARTDAMSEYCILGWLADELKSRSLDLCSKWTIEVNVIANVLPQARNECIAKERLGEESIVVDRSLFIHALAASYIFLDFDRRVS